MNRIPAPLQRLADWLMTLFSPLIRVFGTVLREGVGIVREMLAIPLQLWLAIAEPLGVAVLAVWQRLVLPVAVGAATLGRRVLHWAEAEVTPARATVVVALVAAGALVASQFFDYREVTAGTPAYSGVESVAPAPPVSSDATGAAHVWVMLPLTALALAVIVLATRGRWQLSRLLIPLGLIVIGVAVLVDVPAGLDEGSAATAYQGAEASLLEGFWAQVAAGATLIVCGPLLATHLRSRALGRRPTTASTAAGRRRFAIRWPRRRKGEAALGSSGTAATPIGWEKPTGGTTTT
jgi:hypothetical protein